MSARTDETASERTDLTASSRPVKSAIAAAGHDEDVAAVLAVLAAVTSSGQAAEPIPPQSVWSNTRHSAGRAWVAGRGRWWASGLPR